MQAEVVTLSKPEGYDDWWQTMQQVGEIGEDELKDAWKKSNADYRRYLTATDNDAWEALKTKAIDAKPSQEPPL